MTKISKSPDRHTFQKEGYVKRCEENGEEPSADYLDMFQKILEDADKKWLDPKSKLNNMEWDLVSTDWILEKVRASDSYAQNLYAAMCNNEFTKREMWPILKEEKWSASWRSAGGIVADMRQEGDYIDWYCSGIGGQNLAYDGTMTEEEWKAKTGYVPESVVTEEIESDLHRLGWLVVKYDNSKDI
jgi:hypothetical protein